MKFRARPIVIEAVQLTKQLAENRLFWPEWMRGHDSTATQMDRPSGVWWVSIDTPEGRMRADVGDWIIRGTEGELYPCKPSIFARKYEAVE